MQAAAGCRLLLLAEKTETPKGCVLTSRSCVNSGEVCPASMVSVVSDATTVGTSSMSVVKLFFLERKLFGVYSMEISIRSLGSRSAQVVRESVASVVGKRGEGSKTPNKLR